MAVSSRYVLQQGPMLATLGKTAVRALTQSLSKSKPKLPFVVPSAEVTRRFAPFSSDLLDAYASHVGGDARAYKSTVPAHFFPHWVMPVAAETLANAPYPMTRVLNGGCRMQVNAPIPRGEEVFVRAQLASCDDDGRRAVLTQHVVSGTASAPDALVVDIYAIVPLGGGKRDGKKAERKEPARVPVEAKEIGAVRLGKDAGLSFAKLTGDFNPIHILPAAARAAGFKSVILHGFGTFARTCEALNRGVFGGDTRALRVLDVKFVKPLVLPHEVSFFVLGDQVFVGDAKGGPAYLTGRFETGS
jgi:MaoC like domain